MLALPDSICGSYVPKKEAPHQDKVEQHRQFKSEWEQFVYLYILYS